MGTDAGQKRPRKKRIIVAIIICACMAALIVPVMNAVTFVNTKVLQLPPSDPELLMGLDQAYTHDFAIVSEDRSDNSNVWWVIEDEDGFSFDVKYEIPNFGAQGGVVSFYSQERARAQLDIQIQNISQKYPNLSIEADATEPPNGHNTVTGARIIMSSYDQIGDAAACAAEISAMYATEHCQMSEDATVGAYSLDDWFNPYVVIYHIGNTNAGDTLMNLSPSEYDSEESDCALLDNKDPEFAYPPSASDLESALRKSYISGVRDGMWSEDLPAEAAASIEYDIDRVNLNGTRIDDDFPAWRSNWGNDDTAIDVYCIDQESLFGVKPSDAGAASYSPSGPKAWEDLVTSRGGTMSANDDVDTLTWIIGADTWVATYNSKGAISVAKNGAPLELDQPVDRSGIVYNTGLTEHDVEQLFDVTVAVDQQSSVVSIDW